MEKYLEDIIFIREDVCVAFYQHNKPEGFKGSGLSNSIGPIARNDLRATVFGGVARQTCILKIRATNFLSHSPPPPPPGKPPLTTCPWCSWYWMMLYKWFYIETISTHISVHDPVSIIFNWVYTLIIFSICWTPLSANKTSLSPFVINGESTRRWCHRGAFQKHLWALKSKSS